MRGIYPRMVIDILVKVAVPGASRNTVVSPTTPDCGVIVPYGRIKCSGIISYNIPKSGELTVKYTVNFIRSSVISNGVPLSSQPMSTCVPVVSTQYTETDAESRGHGGCAK